MKTHAMRGKINIGCLVLSVLLISGVYVGFKFGTVYISKYIFNRNLYELAGDVAKDYSSKRYPNNMDVVNAVIKEAEKTSIDLTPEDIRILRRDNQLVIIEVTWEGEIVLPNYTHYFFFEFEAKRNVVY
jgi:hypothetical protein